MTCVFLGLPVAFAIPSYGTWTSEWDIIDAIFAAQIPEWDGVDGCHENPGK